MDNVRIAMTHKGLGLAIACLMAVSAIFMSPWTATAVVAFASAIAFEIVRHRKSDRQYLPGAQFIMVCSLVFVCVGLLTYITETDTTLPTQVSAISTLLTSKYFDVYSVAILLVINVEKLLGAYVDETLILAVLYIISAMKRV